MKPYYDRGGVTLYHASGVEGGLWLAEQGVRGLLLCDPPYSRHTHEKSRAGARKVPLRDGNGNLTRCAISREVDFGFDYLKPAVRRGLARASAALASRWVMFFCDEYLEWQWRISLESAGLEYVRALHWHKVNATPSFTGDRPAEYVERIVLAQNPDHANDRIVLAHKMRETKTGTKPIKKHWNGGGAGNIYTAAIVQEHRPGSTEPRLHKTQKPEDLMTQILEDFADPDDTVIDLTAGSGTTLVCARRLGLRCYGFEIDEKTIADAAQRIDADIDNTTIRARQSGQVEMFKVTQ